MSDVQAGVDLQADRGHMEMHPATGPTKGVLRQIVWVYIAPSKLFSQLSDQPRLWPAVGILLVASACLTVARIGTGVGGLEVDLWTEQQIASLAEKEYGTMPQGQLDDELRSLDRGREFWKFVTKLEDWGRGPARVAFATVVISSALYALALSTGARASAGQISAIVLFAMYVEIPRMALEVLLVHITGMTRVDLSAAAFVQDTSSSVLTYALLRQLDPFQLWFWALVGLGLYQTRQLQGAACITIIIGLALLVGLWNTGWDLLRLIDLFSSVSG